MSVWCCLIADDEPEMIVEQNGRITKTYNRTYLVETDADRAIATEEFFSSAVGILPGSPHPNDPLATCRSLSIGPAMNRGKCRHLRYQWMRIVRLSYYGIRPSIN